MRHAPARRRWLRTLAIALPLAMLGSAGHAQGSWPSRQVTIVVPFAPGGSTDVVARMLAQKFGEMWGQTVVVENRAGAGGNIGAAAVAKATDGHTLLMASGSILTVNPHLYATLPFDPKKDFAAITNVATGPMVVAVPPQSEVRNLEGLVAKAKASPGKVNFGSAGPGSQVHMASERLAVTLGVDLTHIPYKGESAALTDLMAGQVDVVVGNIGAATPLVTGGKLRALAVTSATRTRMLPEVPTVAESGYPGFENSGWFGLLAPAGTPQAAIDRVHKDTVAVLAMPDVVGRLQGLGMQGVGNAPSALAAAIDAESKVWAEVVKARRLKAN
ncbi:MAG TPA: tripartite tricarboxylate transporter substrate binding protein [Rubrivivax sp.]|jgi:tripartite-type tricarboxylate transporter receptor subunit TctC|nr:tripartite tricarboxylate transporter substrate binding protein [Rubrivivax sp.]